MILFVLVPGLLFEAAFNLDCKHLRGNLLAVTALATLGYGRGSGIARQCLPRLLLVPAHALLDRARGDDLRTLVARDLGL